MLYKKMKLIYWSTRTCRNICVVVVVVVAVVVVVRVFHVLKLKFVIAYLHYIQIYFALKK